MSPQMDDVERAEHQAHVESLTPEERLLHNIFCFCMDAEDDETPHGPTSLRHPYTDEELAALGY